jgi:biotin carboxylase
MTGEPRSRLLLLLPTTTYRAGAFVAAADALDVDLTVASEKDSVFSTQESEALLTLNFAKPSECAARVVEFHDRHPIRAVFGVDDLTAVVAAHVAQALALDHNPPAAVEAAGDKFLQRQLLAGAGVPVPGFARQNAHRVDAERLILVNFPAVVKPINLSGSRGVMRVNDANSLAEAITRLRSILEQASPVAELAFLIEDYIPGQEFALEGILENGRLTPLALFDKPDPLEGPTFAETIYLTPSRASDTIQAALHHTAQAACAALGLIRGPVHVELRHNSAGPWLIELAARPIGGRCGEVLRFGPEHKSLETILLAQALGRLHTIPEREPQASGVMMIPVNRAGTFQTMDGLETALATPGVTDIAVTVHRGARVQPLPEESRYLGFIFARGPDPASVESTIRTAFAALDIVIE